MPEGRAGSDTIVAVATAPGRAALAVVRISGPNASQVLGALLGEGPNGPGPGLPEDGAIDLEPRVATLERLVHPGTGEPIDRALVTWFPAPNSYTGEDLVEISCHGGGVVPALLVDAACAAGARPARRGEFTRRAYLNGKLDLVQVEATLDLIEARSTRMSQAALFALERGLSRRVEELREASIRLQALLAYDIDFPEEDDGPVDPERIAQAAGSLERRLVELLRDAPEGELLREGALTVIAGRPNAGKSSLFNILLGTERAIVTEEPGTTRDAIEALLSVDGYPFRLVDTAGLRKDPERIEGMGIEVARSYLERADLALVCVEAGRPPDEEESGFLEELRERLGTDRVLLLRTKCDLVEEASAEGGNRDLWVSVVGPRGLEGLRQRMLSAVYEGLSGSEEAPLVTRRRHARALTRARESIAAFRETWDAGHPPEIASTHVQDAVLALEELLGVVTTEDVLDALFSSFCVGK